MPIHFVRLMLRKVGDSNWVSYTIQKLAEYCLTLMPFSAFTNRADIDQTLSIIFHKQVQ